MKLLILCEGPNELAVVQMLLDADCFVFSRDDLLDCVLIMRGRLINPLQ